MSAGRDLAAVLTLVAERGPALRRAGVLELQHDGLRVVLAPHVEVAPAGAEAPQEELTPLEDPESYGLPPGSEVPGFPALRERRREKERS